MPDIWPAMIAGASSIAVALISAGVIGRRRKKAAVEAEMDPFVSEIFKRWEACERRLRQLRDRGKTGQTSSSSPEESS